MLNPKVLLQALLTLGLAKASLCLDAVAALQLGHVHEQNKTNGARIISDFDGDSKPDLATIRFEGRNCRVEIKLSSRPERTFFTSTFDLGAGLLTLDVDEDKDQDLVILDSKRPQPFEVWLNNGRGRFRKGNLWHLDHFLGSGGRSVYKHKGYEVGQDLVNEDEIPTYDISSVFTDAKPQARDSIFVGFRRPSSRILSYKLLSRSPPLRPTL